MSFIFLRQHLSMRPCNLIPKTRPGWILDPYPRSFQCAKSTSPRPKEKYLSQPSKMIKGNGERTLTPKTYRYQEAKSKIAPAKRTSVPGEKRWTPEELKREHGIHRRIQKKRKNLLWPGLFTVVSIAGIYYGFAYLDERFDLQDNDLAPAARRSQSWYLTPTVVSEGFVNYWKELDKMTIGVMALYFGLHLVKRMPNKFWEKLPHIAGERTWTLATYSLVHSSNQGVFSAIFYLAWFMPAVVRYFDGDYLHLSAFYFSVPILLGVLTHLRFKGKNAIRGIPVEMGSSGALSALVGAYTMINPWEKVWFVVTGPFRVDAIYIAGGMVLNEIWRMYKLRGTGLPATISHSSHLLGLAFGAAYVYFDAKGRLWEPLRGSFSKSMKKDESSEGHKTSGQPEGDVEEGTKP